MDIETTTATRSAAHSDPHEVAQREGHGEGRAEPRRDGSLASSLRTVLWVGSSASLVENGIPDAATLDVVWTRTTQEALELAWTRFDVIVIAFEDTHEIEAALPRFAAHASAPPLLVLAPAARAERLRGMLALDAGEVLATHRAADDDGTQLDSPPRSPAPSNETLEIPVGDVRHPPTPVAVEARDGAAQGSHARGLDPTTRLRRLLVSRIDQLASRRQHPQPPTRSRRSHRIAKHYPEIVGESEVLLASLDLVERAAQSLAAVLLTGETGTGKEVFARAIHRRGNRARAPFIAVNCAALTDTLLESELFGHVKGAFTGATSTRPGLFDLADGGTLFLDEIGETSPAMQAKLLRALQDKEIRPVGGGKSRRVDVRIVTATNRDLRSEASRGRFRQDLYYRLAILPIPIPPLRKRGEDVLLLAQYFLGLYGDDPVRGPRKLSQAAAERLLAHPWPGNVRELENEIQRAVTLAEPGQLIMPSLLSCQVNESTVDFDRDSQPGETLRQAVARVEALVIRRALADNGGRRAITARQLGLTREGLYKKMKRLGVE